MCYIKARFAAVYGHEPGIISPSTSSSSNSVRCLITFLIPNAEIRIQSSGLFDESSEFDIDSNIEKRVSNFFSFFFLQINASLKSVIAGAKHDRRDV